jgi:hypothetical protein
MQLTAAIQPYKAKTDLFGYIWFFFFVQQLDPHTVSLAMVAALQGTTVQAMLSKH